MHIVVSEECQHLILQDTCWNSWPSYCERPLFIALLHQFKILNIIFLMYVLQFWHSGLNMMSVVSTLVQCSKRLYFIVLWIKYYLICVILHLVRKTRCLMNNLRKKCKNSFLKNGKIRTSRTTSQTIHRWDRRQNEDRRWQGYNWKIKEQYYKRKKTEMKQILSSRTKLEILKSFIKPHDEDSKVLGIKVLSHINFQ